MADDRITLRTTHIRHQQRTAGNSRNYFRQHRLNLLASSNDVCPVKLSTPHNLDPGHTPLGCPQVLSGLVTARCGRAGRRGVGSDNRRAGRVARGVPGSRRGDVDGSRCEGKFEALRANDGRALRASYATSCDSHHHATKSKCGEGGIRSCEISISLALSLHCRSVVSSWRTGLCQR